MIVIGSTVEFPEIDDEGFDTTIVGIVRDKFREPPEEDALERLNYRVVANSDGRVYTPYAHECTEVMCDVCENTSVGLNLRVVCRSCQEDDDRDYYNRTGLDASDVPDDTPCLDTSFHDHEMEC